MTVTGEARNFTATITILDADGNAIGSAYDVSDAVSSWKVDFAGLNLSGPNGYRPWTGELFLEDGITAESLDAWDTVANPSGASLLAQGNAIDLRVWDGTAFSRSWPTLYILRVPSLFDPLSSGERNTTIEVGDITQLRGLRSPEGKLSKAMALGTSTTRSSIANAALSDVGLPSSADVISEYPLSVPPQKFSQDSTPNEIGRLVGTAGYNFWVDKDDNIRFTKINLDKSAPDFSLVIGTDEFGRDGWVRRNLAERPPVELVVTAAGGRAIAKDNPFTSEDIRTEKETTFTREIFPVSSRVTESTEIEESEREILPRIPTQSSGNVTGYTENTSTSLRTSFRESITREYSSITGLLRSEQIETEVAKGKAGGDAFRDTDTVSDAYNLITTSLTTITYDYSDGQMSRRQTSVQRPWALIPWKNVRPDNYEINRFLVQTNLTIDERWDDQLFGKNWEYSFVTQRPQGELDNYYGAATNASVLRNDPSETGEIESSDGGDATPPRAEYMPLLYEQSDDQYSGSVTITPLAGNAHKNAEETVTIQGPYGVSNAQCDELAQLIARLRHGLNLAQQGVFAIPPWILSSFSPNARVDIDDNGLIRSYALNGWTITADNTSTLWGATFARLGDVGVSPDIVVQPIQLTLSALGVGGSVVGGSGLFISPEILSGAGGLVIGGSGAFDSTRFDSVGGLVVGGAGALVTPDAAQSVGGPVIGGSGVFETTRFESVGGLVIGGSGTLSGATDPDADAFIARLAGTYTQAELDAINQWFVDTKAAGVYSKLDAVWMQAVDTQADALLNMLGTNYSLTNVGGLTFTARQGFTGNGSGYLDTGFNPSTAGGNYTQNSASFGVYLRTNVAQNSFDMGSLTDSFNNRSTIASRWLDGSDYFIDTNAQSLQRVSGNSSDSRGFWIATRTSPTLQSAYQSGSLLGTNSGASDAPLNGNFYMLAANQNGVSSAHSTKQLAFGFAGGGLTQADVTALNNATQALLTAFGANI